MKKQFIWIKVILITTFAILFVLALTACSLKQFVQKSVTNNDVPKTVTINGITYRSGFYGDLWPNNITYKGDSIKVGVNEFLHVNCQKFDWVHSDIGSTTEGIIYCAESQWEQARAYYADSNNFVYYCSIGAEYTDRDPVIATIPNIDSKKFDALMAFANKNSYNPFGSNKGVKTRRLPIPDRDKSPELGFYKESKDGLFTSYEGYKFHVIEGKLLLVFFYDCGHGKYEELVAVDVPDKLGHYFIKLLEQFKK